MNVIGIDPSLAGTGVCLPSGEAYTIKSKLKGDDRLEFIYNRIVESIEDFHPISLAVLEDLPVNAKSAGLTGMAQGVIRMALASADVPVARIAPATLKKFATGSGKADKRAMYEAIPPGLRSGLDDDNQVDAWWLREAGYAWLGKSIVYDPDNQEVREILSKAKWPEMEVAA